MTALNKYAALRQLAEESTQGEWWSDVVETDGEYGDGEDRASGYHSYAVYVGSESLLDMTNSTAACIHTEWDHDYLMAWDETAKRNAEFIAAANPATVLVLLDELEAAEKCIAELEAVREVFLRAKALMYQSGGAPIENSLNPIDAWLYDAERVAAGIGVKGGVSMEREYFILSTAHTQRGDPYITLWAENDSGYRCRCHTAGRYAESHVLSNLGYYNNGVQTMAVPCDVAEPLSHSVAKGFFDDNDGRWLRNNAATWKELMKHAIAVPKHTPAPQYRGAPRKPEG